jgi:hypothetical protein
MKTSLTTLAAALAAILATGGPATAQQSSATAGQTADTARPRDSTANLPSDSGAQTSLPSGAVTGAGHPHGKGKQADVGAPGGAEPRAREEARQETRGTGAASTTGGGGEAGSGANTRPKSERSGSSR